MQADKTIYRRAVVEDAIRRMESARQSIDNPEVELQSGIEIDRALNNLIELAANAESLRTMLRLDTHTISPLNSVREDLESELQHVDQDVAYQKAEVIYAMADYAVQCKLGTSSSGATHLV